MASSLAVSTEQQILVVAERLFAERGVDGVSLRQIASAVGNGNNSAVQYHFGSKERLVQAIFESRLPRLWERRDLLMIERRPKNVRSLVECQVRAVLEQSELEGSYYISFLAMLYQQARWDMFDQLPDEFRERSNEYEQLLAAALPQIPEPFRQSRIERVMAMTLQAVGVRELARARGRSRLPFAVELNDLVDGIVGFLEAEVSPAALASIEGPTNHEGWPAFF